MEKIAITGSSGFVGQNIKKRFEKNGFKVIGIKREQLKDENSLINIMENTDILINLAGANIIQRWSDSYKKILYSSRIDTTKALTNAISKASKKSKLLISTSAVGIYKNEKCYDEDFYEYENDFLANLCKTWEEEALHVKSYGVRVAIFRFGIVLGDGGALKKMLTTFKLGLGGIIGDGKQHFSFIHINDLLNAYEFVIENHQCEGIFNLTAPNPTTNYKFTKTLGKVLNRPTIFPVPKFILKLIFGEGATVLINGQCVKPKKLLDKGFKFQFENIEKTLKDLV